MDNKKRDDYTVNMPLPERGSLGGSPSPNRMSAKSGGGLHVPSQITNNPAVSVGAYCMASISMTVINKFCVSGTDWNLSFLFLAIQVCISIF